MIKKVRIFLKKYNPAYPLIFGWGIILLSKQLGLAGMILGDLNHRVKSQVIAGWELHIFLGFFSGVVIMFAIFLVVSVKDLGGKREEREDNKLSCWEGLICSLAGSFGAFIFLAIANCCGIEFF
jgi:hypothetical protein